MHGHVHVKDAARFDPTGTGDIRARFRRDMEQRWARLKFLTKEAINEHDLLGIGPLSFHSIQRGIDNPLRAFQVWLDTALGRIITAHEGEWISHYLEEAAARARSRAYLLVMPSADTRPETVQSIMLVRASMELQGIAEAVSQRVMRVVSQGMLTRTAQRTIARNAEDAITAVATMRSRAMVEMSVVSAFNNSTLDVFKSLGLKRVNTVPESIPAGSKVVRRRRVPLRRRVGDARKRKDEDDRDEPPGPNLQGAIEEAEAKVEALELVEVLTAGDDDVCEECEDISADGPYDVDVARGLISAHPNCRCAFVPYFDERFAGRED